MHKHKTQQQQPQKKKKGYAHKEGALKPAQPPRPVPSTLCQPQRNSKSSTIEKNSDRREGKERARGGRRSLKLYPYAKQESGKKRTKNATCTETMYL